MTKSITGRITINLVGGILVTVITIVLAISWMARQQNDQAAEATATMVDGGVEAMNRRLKTIANDYAWWEEAYDAFRRDDAEWMYDNIGSSVEETMIADMMAIISPEGSVDHGWIGETVTVSPQEILTPEVIAGIRAAMEGVAVDNEAARTAYVASGDGVMMIAFSRIAPVSSLEGVDPADLPYFVTGFALSESRLSELGESFLIDDLRIEPLAPSADAEGYPVVTDVSGQQVARLVWTPPKPGWVVLRDISLPILGAIGLFCVISLATALRARGMAVALADSEKQAVTAARTDRLTGLTNRAGFGELIESQAVAEVAKGGEIAIIYLDVNGFKAVNDSVGHHGGDELVIALSKRLCSVLPEGATLGRIGGDEFAALVVGRDAGTAAATAAAALVRALDEPFAVFGFEFHVTAAVGYAIAEGGAATPIELLRRADLAMYQAKNGAEREPLAYHPAMETGALERKQIETALRRAVEAGELTVTYQPVVKASDLSMIAVEALVRWNSREFGPVSPALFIPVAEETGLIHDIGRFVITTACQDIVRWPGLRVSVNVSPVQLKDPNFASEIRALVERHGLSPVSFELELTEGILVNNPTIAKRKLEVLREYGFSLALDDFGTGFSSIGYLRQFPFSKLKLDRSFVREIGVSPTATALIQAVVSLGDAMDLPVIAEGIETEEQLNLLRLVECEYIQGFYVSKPVPAAEITKLLESATDDRRLRVRSSTPPVPQPSLAAAR